MPTASMGMAPALDPAGDRLYHASMASVAQITTAGQLLDAPGLGRCELLRGELVMMTPAGFEHGRIVSAITVPLGAFIKEHGLGITTGAETGFQIGRDPDTVRAPDVGFLSAARAPKKKVPGFFPGAPDLAVEVLSPNDRASEVLAKARDWLAAGCRAVWVVDPQTETVTVHSGGGIATTLDSAETLSGGELLPGFSLPVAEIFAA